MLMRLTAASSACVKHSQKASDCLHNAHSFCLRSHKSRSAALKIAHLKLRVNHGHRSRPNMMTQVERGGGDWKVLEQRQHLSLRTSMIEACGRSTASGSNSNTSPDVGSALIIPNKQPCIASLISEELLKCARAENEPTLSTPAQVASCNARNTFSTRPYLQLREQPAFWLDSCARGCIILYSLCTCKCNRCICSCFSLHVQPQWSIIVAW
jgi:hypothetical protein